MQWVKLRVSLRHNRAFLRLSKNAKLAFFGALMAVAEYDQGGALTMRQGPLTADEIAADLMLSRRESTLAVRELVHAGFFERDENDTISIAKFQEKTESDSAARMRRLRAKQRLESALSDVTEAVTVTAQLCHSDRHSDASHVTTEEEKDIPTISVDKSTSLVGTATPNKAEPSEPEWATKLRATVHGLGSRKLKTLSTDERIVGARYHCLTFANCNKSEANNKAKASQVAAALASMARNETYGELSVRQYFLYGQKVHEQREKKPWYDPWLIRAVVEFE